MRYGSNNLNKKNVYYKCSIKILDVYKNNRCRYYKYTRCTPTRYRYSTHNNSYQGLRDYLYLPPTYPVTL